MIGEYTFSNFLGNWLEYTFLILIGISWWLHYPKKKGLRGVKRLFSYIKWSIVVAFGYLILSIIIIDFIELIKTPI